MNFLNSSQFKFSPTPYFLNSLYYVCALIAGFLVSDQQSPVETYNPGYWQHQCSANDSPVYQSWFWWSNWRYIVIYADVVGGDTSVVDVRGWYSV